MKTRGKMKKKKLREKGWMIKSPTMGFLGEHCVSEEEAWDKFQELFSLGKEKVMKKLGYRAVRVEVREL